MSQEQLNDTIGKVVEVAVSEEEMILSKKRADRLKEIQEQFNPGDDSDLARIIAQINANNKK